MDNFKTLVQYCLNNDVTDLHITGAHPVAVRKNGKIFYNHDVKFTPKDVDNLVRRLLSSRQREILSSRWSVDAAVTLSNVRLRLNVVFTTRGLTVSIRFLPGRPPVFDNLNLHSVLRKLCDHTSGIILFCGATGSGKTTSIASLLEIINSSRQAHIVTLEDPIEYKIKSKLAFVEQRELGVHFHTFEQGLLDVLRQMPDVILVGELRDPEEIRLALNAAESGHLVFATLHAGNVEEALYRVFNSFPPDAQDFIRYQVSCCLRAVVVQQLHFVEKAGFRVPHLCMAQDSTALRNLIRENRLSHLENLLETGRKDGHFSFQRYKTEFLDLQTRFIKPSTNFRPVQGQTLEQEYSSSLIDTAAHLQHRLLPRGMGDNSTCMPDQHAEETPDRELQQYMASISLPTNIDED